MRTFACLSLTLLFAAGGRAAPPEEKPWLEMTDPGYALWELRPLDRRVYVLTLEGKWERPARRGAVYYVNVRFPDGGGYDHRVLDDALARAGEVRAMIQEYQLIRHKVARGGTFTVFVTERPAAGAPAEVVSNRLKVTWPMDRDLVPRAPASRYTPKEPADELPPADEPPVPPPPRRGPPKTKPPAGPKKPGEPLPPPKPAPRDVPPEDRG
jgi:hypothetical protein